MRKNAKKLFALILALCMSLTLLTACGGDTAGSDSGVGESSSVARRSPGACRAATP